MSHNECPGCNKPMIDGQAFNGLLKCHWDCQDAVRLKVGDSVANDIIQKNINKALLQQGIGPSHRLWKTLGGS